jgi:hypothetical protein
VLPVELARRLLRQTGVNQRGLRPQPNQSKSLNRREQSERSRGTLSVVSVSSCSKCAAENKKPRNSNTAPPARKRRERGSSPLIAPVPRHCLGVSGPLRRPSTPRSGIGADQLARGADGGNAGTQASCGGRFREAAPTTEYTDTGARCRNGGFSACFRPTRTLTQRTTADRTRRVVVRMIARLAACSRARLLRWM